MKAISTSKQFRANNQNETNIANDVVFIIILVQVIWNFIKIYFDICTHQRVLNQKNERERVKKKRPKDHFALYVTYDLFFKKGRNKKNIVEKALFAVFGDAMTFMLL